MRSFLAALRTLVLPYGRNSGKRIILDGVEGTIVVYNTDGIEVARITPDDGFWTSSADANPDLRDEAKLVAGGVHLIGGAGGSSFFQNGEFGMSLNDADYYYHRLTGPDGGRLRLTIPGDSLMVNKPVRAFDPNNGSEPESWHAMTLQNSWVKRVGTQYGTPSYHKTAYNWVALGGTGSGGTITNGTVITNLPVGYRPLTEHYVPISVNSGYTQTTLVKPNGDVVLFRGSGEDSGWSAFTFMGEFPLDL